MTDEDEARYQLLAKQIAFAKTPAEAAVAREALRRLCEQLERKRAVSADTER